MTIPIARLVPLGVVLLLLAHTPAAMGAGINIFWNDCAAGNGVSNHNFACNTNTGASVLVASFEPPDGIVKLVGGSAVIDIRGAATVLPSWWQLGVGGCRQGALQLSFAPPSDGCVDYWSGAATGSVSFEPGYGGYSYWGRFWVSWGIPEALAGPVQYGTEYLAFKLIVDHSKTVGTEACAGCLDPGCIQLSAIWLYQTPGLPDYSVCNPAYNNLATFQGGNIGGPGCPGTDQSPPPFPFACGTAPTFRRTWGALKGLYR